MRSMNFVPKYRENQKQNKFSLILNLSLIFFILLLCSKIYYINKNLNVLDKEIKLNAEHTKYKIQNHVKVDCIKRFNDFYLISKDYIKINNLNINNKIIILDVDILNNQKYIEFIKSIQKSNLYKIKEFQKYDLEDNKIRLIMNLEVIN